MATVLGLTTGSLYGKACFQGLSGGKESFHLDSLSSAMQLMKAILSNLATHSVSVVSFLLLMAFCGFLPCGHSFSVCRILFLSNM